MQFGAEASQDLLSKCVFTQLQEIAHLTLCLQPPVEILTLCWLKKKGAVKWFIKKKHGSDVAEGSIPLWRHKVNKNAEKEKQYS